MRYFTKEWYVDSLVAEMCFQLRKTDKAGTFSDKFFEKLYLVERKAYLKHCKRAAKFEKRKYDEAASSAEFDANYKTNLEFVKSNLPAEILDEVKDIRVLALGSVTYEIADKITRHCGKVNRKCDIVRRQCDEATDAAVDKLGGMLPRALSDIFGAPVASIGGDGCGNTVITTSAEYTGVALRVTLENAEQIELEEGLVGSMVCNYELLVTDSDKFEFSLLTLAEDSSLYTATFVSETFKIEEIV